MEEKLIILLVLVFLGLIMLIFGYLVKFKEKINLIAGIKDPEKQITDKKKFTSSVGLGVILIGLVLGVMGILKYFYSHSARIIETIGLVVILVCGVMIYLTARKYIQKN